MSPVAGYILVGGKSTRMGVDKALLESGRGTLVDIVASAVACVTGSAVLVGDPVKYGHLGYRVIPDLRPHNGPLSGLEAALLHSSSEWNLILACDLASTNPDFLTLICREAQSLESSFDCLVPRECDGKLQPLSAMYRRRCLAEFSGALDRGELRLLDAVARLQAAYSETEGTEVFQNVNTPAQWTRYLNDRIN